MKKLLKKELLIGFILGIILASSIAVYAVINASEIDYKNGKKVSQALDDLYSKIPSGTIPITTKGNQIDVSQYQYADTTGLYTSDEIQGTNVTITLPQTGNEYNYNFEYNPRFVFFCEKNGSRRWFTLDSGTSWYDVRIVDDTYQYRLYEGNAINLVGNVLAFRWTR